MLDSTPCIYECANRRFVQPLGVGRCFRPFLKSRNAARLLRATIPYQWSEGGEVASHRRYVWKLTHLQTRKKQVNLCNEIR
jgi:hypothetical protein